MNDDSSAKKPRAPRKKPLPLDDEQPTSKDGTTTNELGGTERTTTSQTTDGTATKATGQAQANEAGEVPLMPPAADSLDVENQPVILVALARDGESRAACWERLRKEARAIGMKRGQGPGTAYEWATREVERLFPPPEPEPIPELEPEILEEPEVEMSPIGDTQEPEPIEPTPAPTSNDEVSGLGDLPGSWGSLPANAQLQVEIAWVSANRLRVRSGNGVDLSRALSPAPSYSALSWLETSILFPSKFADISVKATAQQDDEREHIRREKLAIEEIRSLLAEMLEG
jgi:hypothetical protein